VIGREPQGPIQQSQGGLLGFLGIVGAETAPNSLGGSIVPIIDAQQFIALNRRKQLFEAIVIPMNATGNSTFTTAVVPPGRTWLIMHASVLVFIPGGASIQQAALTVGRGTIMNIISQVPSYFAPGANATYLVAGTPGVLLLPGSTLSVYTSGYAGAATTANLYLDYIDIPI